MEEIREPNYGNLKEALGAGNAANITSALLSSELFDDFMDTVISLYHPITCNLLNYKVAGKVVTYLEPIALPDSMMGAQSGIMLFAEMVGGEPLIPVLATRSPEQKYTFGLADGCFSYSTEVNQGYHIIAKVRVGAKEFVLAESPTAPSRFATWARTPANDGDGEPNYYHGNYCSDRNAAILDFCNRARNQYEYAT